MQLALGFWGLAAFVWIFLFFPETSHPGARGVEKIDPVKRPTWRPVILNPLAPLWLLRSPNVLAVVGPCFTGICAISHCLTNM